MAHSLTQVFQHLYYIRFFAQTPLETTTFSYFIREIKVVSGICKVPVTVLCEHAGQNFRGKVWKATGGSAKSHY
jgi:hypothetical protein